MSTNGLPLVISWFDTAYPRGPAIGDPERTTWGAFAEVFSHRREGDKDGCCFATARFTMEADGRHVRRLKANLVARTAIALDIEPSTATGEVPPAPTEALSRAEARGLACIVYTSHSHQPDTNIRYRIVFPLSAEIAVEIPAPEIMAKQLGLAGVLDVSKVGASSLFYSPSCEDEAAGHHYTRVLEGYAVDALWITNVGEANLQIVRAEAEQVAAAAQAQAAARMEAKIAAGFDPDDSLIEKIRSRLDLEQILLDHGYDKEDGHYRHPNSSSGIYGANVKSLGGIPRIFSHNATDPLHGDNLPAWCGGVTAIDAFDVLAILNFCGDRTKALRELAERFKLSKMAERKALAGVLFRLIKRRVNQHEIEAAAFAEGERLGLSRDEVCCVAQWVAGQTAEQAA